MATPRDAGPRPNDGPTSDAPHTTDRSGSSAWSHGEPEPGRPVLRRATRPHPALGIGLGAVLQGRYCLTGMLEVSDVATFYQGEDVETGRAVAATVFQEIGRNDQARIDDLHRPRPHSASPLVLPSVFATVHACDLTDDGRLFVVTEFLEGPSVAELLKRAPLPPIRALELAMRLGEALEVVLNLGALDLRVASQDVVLLNEGDRLKLRRSDMLIVRRLGLADALAAAEAPGRDPRYASPEELAQLPVTEGSVVYRFGILLYELLDGSPPFDGTTPAEVRDQQRRSPPTPLQDRHRALPASVDRLVSRMLASDPAVRPVDLTWILNELWDAACHVRATVPAAAIGTTSSPGPAVSTGRFRTRHLVMGGLSVLCLGSVLLAWPYLADGPLPTTAGPSPVRSAITGPAPTELVAPPLTPGPPSRATPGGLATSVVRDVAPPATPSVRRHTPVASPARELAPPPSPPVPAETSEREPAQAPTDTKTTAPRSAPTLPSGPETARIPPPALPRQPPPDHARAADPGAIIDWLVRESPTLSD
jgi:hypothetical protein